MFGEKHKYILYISAMYISKSYRHWSFCIILPLVGPPKKKLPFSPWAQKKSLGSKHVWWHGIPVIIRDPRHSVRPKPPLFRVAKKKISRTSTKKNKRLPSRETNVFASKKNKLLGISNLSKQRLLSRLFQGTGTLPRFLLSSHRLIGITPTITTRVDLAAASPRDLLPAKGPSVLRYWSNPQARGRQDQFLHHHPGKKIPPNGSSGKVLAGNKQCVKLCFDMSYLHD